MKTMRKNVTFFEFKGLMAPVFTCFNNDEGRTLNTQYINRYAKWLKSHNIDGVLVNGLLGEGPNMTLQERKINAEAWWRAAISHNLKMMLQVGGAPISEVLTMSEFAEELGVHCVCCLPDIYYKPGTIDQLVSYCQMVAKHCPSRPFFYYHIPKITSVELVMGAFCDRAEDHICNFYGLYYKSTDLDMGINCLNNQRIIFTGASRIFSSSFVCGMNAFLMGIFNIFPQIAADIYNALKLNNLTLAQEKQTELDNLIFARFQESEIDIYVGAMKKWFNEEMLRNSSGAGFAAGPTRGC